MSHAAAEAFIDQVASNADLLRRLEDARHSIDEVAAVIATSGYDATPYEVVDAFLERFGRFLNDEVLTQYAGGYTTDGLTTVEILALYASVFEYLRNPNALGI